MRKSMQKMRRLVLSKLFDHLEQNYSVDQSRESFLSGNPDNHLIDMVLSFKSDPHLEELRSALDRLQEGSFGTCLSCKGWIEQRLLDEDPARRLCGECDREIVHSSLHLHVEGMHA
ncbi:MAG: hypothetical protein WB626_02075 [Bacteroidota bacterium]